MTLETNLGNREEIEATPEASHAEDKVAGTFQNPVKNFEDQSGEDLQEVDHHFCVFNAGKEEYAIPIEIVKEVVKYSAPASIPQMPGYILGMSNVRGNIYGVMSLESYFRKDSPDTDYKYLLVLDHDIYKMALCIHEVPNSLMITEDQIEQLNSSSLKSVIDQKFLQGIIKIDKRMVIVLDLLDLIASEEFTKIGD